MIIVELAQPLGKKIRFFYDEDEEADIEPTASPASPHPKFKHAGTFTDAAAGPSTPADAVPGSAVEARMSTLAALMNHKFEVV